MGETPLILSVDTATLGGSVCLTRGKEILASINGDAKASHSNTLLRDIDLVFRTSNATIREVALFAASVGPGSFTGLRIGLASVKALSATLERPCVGIPTLQAVAHLAGPSKATVAMLPAGRGELFAQLFSVDSDGNVQTVDEAAHLKPAEVWSRYAGIRELKWAGDGALIHAPALREQARANGIAFFDEADSSRENGGWTLARPGANLAASVAAIALSEFQRGNAVRPEDLRAIYVRPSDAEINQKWPNEKLPSM
ncbi:MAG TPA: tRNA (adenosine(37)-N6)-threonylcarbamoyltransferase complex dimerization subunit type 1 TsaB [Pyrinomonadaceae bacterium]|jgi:tRNA threonylcarbamoyladenosine biosynthesis protein TsaB